MSKTLIAVLLLLALVLLVAHLEHRWVPVEEEMRSAYLRQCDAMVTDGEHYHNMPAPRCYFFKDRK